MDTLAALAIAGLAGTSVGWLTYTVTGWLGLLPTLLQDPLAHSSAESYMTRSA